MKKSRKERKLEAKQNGVPFTPQYNGNGVVSFEEYFEQGIERFNNKFVQYLKPVEEIVDVSEVETELENVEVIETTSFEKAPKKKKGKIKKALKKLFNK
ncbi:hypothetical protein GAG94_02975 [Lysinibacillus sphaericus]|nr:hypothetical protein GAG94_02975 [Lysinibacillus sphaericus]